MHVLPASKLTAAVAAAAMFAVGPALAQQSKDTLRIAFHDPISSVDLLYDRKPETGFTGRSVIERLVSYNSKTGKYEPYLAASWKQIDPRTMEFKLKKNVKFHDGSDFDADDFVYTINWLTNPKVRLRGKGGYVWIDHVEKIDKHTVRVVSKRPYALALGRFAVNIPMLPGDVHGSYKVKSDFGKKAVGTGPYRVVSVDPRKGVIMERNKNYRHRPNAIPAATINRIHVRQVPDIQTQVAELLTGNIDAIYGVPKDQLAALAANPNLRVTVSNGIVLYYMAIDAAGRSPNKVLKDQRVRKALMQAVDRKLIVNSVVPGGDQARILDAYCVAPIQVACSSSTKPPAFDRGAARKLLAEAGLADGFEVTITAILSAGPLAEAIAGELRKIKVRATIRKLTMGSFRKAQRQGQQEILVAPFSSGGLPDAASPLGYLFSGTGRDFWRDPLLMKIEKDGQTTLDPARRRALYQQAYDQINNKNYVLPISTKPDIWVHAKNVEIIPDPLAALGAHISGFRWKK